MSTYNGEPVADPARFIRLTLRGHPVRWRLERELARPAPAHLQVARGMDHRPTPTAP